MFDRRLLTHFDWVLLLQICLLVGVGIINLYSATSSWDPVGTSICVKQLYWFGIGKDDFLWEMGKNLDAALTRNGMEHTFYVTEGGHTWANWRVYLNTFAPLLFK